MSELDTLCDIRDFKSSDLAFVKATFLRGLYYGFDDKNVGGAGWFGAIPKDIFMENYSAIADALIAKSTVKMVCLKEDADVILGYSILSNDFQTVHFVYVKKIWRQKGLGRVLTPQHFTQCTHLTAMGKKLLPKFQHAIFNPFAI